MKTVQGESETYIGEVGEGAAVTNPLSSGTESAVIVFPLEACEVCSCYNSWPLLLEFLDLQLSVNTDFQP